MDNQFEQPRSVSRVQLSLFAGIVMCIAACVAIYWATFSEVVSYENYSEQAGVTIFLDCPGEDIVLSTRVGHDFVIAKAIPIRKSGELIQLGKKNCIDIEMVKNFYGGLFVYDDGSINIDTDENFNTKSYLESYFNINIEVRTQDDRAGIVYHTNSIFLDLEKILTFSDPNPDRVKWVDGYQIQYSMKPMTKADVYTAINNQNEPPSRWALEAKRLGVDTDSLNEGYEVYNATFFGVFVDEKRRRNRDLIIIFASTILGLGFSLVCEAFIAGGTRRSKAS